MLPIARAGSARTRRSRARLPTPSARWIGQWWLWAPPVVVASSFVTGLIVANTPRAREQELARQAIDACWNGFKTPPSADAERVDPGTCLRLEASYQQRFDATR
ncbi:MAG TPA: hypothetical protein PKC59_03655 [Burkholderiaceae bacterium]|nr:hypothetical protein [Burkholderiaceae bacterium]HMX10516.1 hypothetical protein [Burkholderiaceae bacterium]HMY98811.1 hypothetical protein [Burkholderiaceae bacterium]HNB42920.1 hypothetical protein [Burkholderiaceae bacterium]HNG79197.1 hypothetical protein [Burkholderiaceae bacterium]